MPRNLIAALIALGVPIRRPPPTDDELFEAGQESFQRRVTNTEDGGTVFKELHRRGWSYRAIAKRIPGATKDMIQRWANPPGREES